MIKVLLVDDNRFALEYFSHLISWEKYGFEVVGTALDGEFAFTQFLTYSPQVVITDIQMPNIDGIELTRKILQTAPETVIIFLSSYEEFKYAQSALQLGVYDYIIKHEVTEESLALKLADIRKIILNSSLERRYINEGNLLYLINEANHFSSDKVQQIFHYFSEQYDLCMLIQDHVFPEFERFSSSPDQEILENDIKNYLYQYSEVIAAVRLEKYTYALLLKSDHAFYETANTLISCFRTTFHSTASMILIAEKSTIRNCFRDYSQVRENIDRKYFYLPSSILYRDVFQTTSSANVNTQAEELLRLSKSQDFGAVYQLLQESFQPIILLRDICAFRALTHTALEILCAFRRQTLHPHTQSSFGLSSIDAKTYWYDASSIFHWLLKQFDLLLQIRQESASNTYSKAVNDVLLFIHQNYSNSELSVESIAEHFGINMNQLNYLFKKEVGETVIKWIIRIRMEQAQKLLNEKNSRISDISKMVGYSSISYFSNVFKKYYGVSPQEYRRKHE